MKRKFVLISLVLVFLGTGVHSQSINNLQFPPSTKWKKIETSRCILIFPANLEPKAAELAVMLDSFYPADQYSLNTKAGKWPVIINNTTVETNGYVMGAPRHSQLYTVPSQDGFSGTADWLPFLWSHELRHIVQNEKMMRGFTLFAHWIAGEYGSSGMPHFAIPSWLWEGDAVLTETLLTTGGRGRLPGFERGMRTNLLNGIRWNYYKAGMGYYASYNSRVPSWYVMGYHLCTHIRKVYGIEAFNRIIEISADFSFTPLIFNIAVKKVTGRSITKIYEDCLNELSELWSSQAAQQQPTEINTITAAEKYELADYYPLGEFSNGDIAALKTSASKIYSLVRIDSTGREQLLRKINPIDRNISFNGSTFCWSEEKKDIRWGRRSWAVIRLYSPEEKAYRLVTQQSRYLSPSISPDGTRIAAVEVTEELRSYIVVIDAVTGTLISRISEPSGAAASQTCWTDDGKKIIYIRQQDWMKSIRILNPDLKTNRGLTEASGFNISKPETADGAVYYISDKSGIEEVWAASLSEDKTYRVAAAAYGADSPAVAGDKLLFSNYTAAGFTVAAIDLTDIPPGKKPPDYEKHIDYFRGLETEEEYYGFAGPGFDGNLDADSTDYEVENYYPVLGLFNLHSRSIGTSLSGTGTVLALQADSILNYSSGQLYTGWDSTEREAVLGLSGAWAGFYPVILYGAELQTPLPEFAAEFESVLYGGLSLPLNFSNGIYSNSLGIRSIFRMENQLYPYRDAKTAVQSSISWGVSQYMAKRDLITTLGFRLTGEWYYNLTPAYYNFIFGEIKLYLPGLITNHGLTLTFQADYNLDSAPVNNKAVEVPRGLNAENYRVPLLYNTSINYSLPLAYPDLNIGGFIYIPRFYLNCFVDTAFIIDDAQEYLQTTGIEFFTDFHLFNNTFPLTAGLRFIYNTIDGGMRFEDTVFMIGIDLL